ncbi:MAG: U32 family peptidase [Syntrophomonadaceae bacterium]|nr:U32 family peptidase [Syntrophomonadaceae bacterium]
MPGPELVLPAGDGEKLTTALLFGADSVYAGGKEFSLRAYAGNLSRDELVAAVGESHRLGKKIYVTVNILAHNRDIGPLPPFLEELDSLGVDGLIVSDPGIFRLARVYCPEIPITVSTQANVSNYESAAFYRDMGAARIVLARELSLEEIIRIKSQVEVELEVFVHGAMCVSYSGRCLLSHYMTGRSANQGACAHPCRYSYQVVEEKRPGQYYPVEEDEHGTYIFNSRDLCLLRHLPGLIEAGVDAFKVEGRMKSPLYAATVARVYRQAIDRYLESRQPYTGWEIEAWMRELHTVATRPFTDGFIAGESPQIMDIHKTGVFGRTDFCGVVKGYDHYRGWVEVEQRANFGPGEHLQLLLPGGELITLDLQELFDAEGQLLDRARHPLQRVFFSYDRPLPEYSLIRRKG